MGFVQNDIAGFSPTLVIVGLSAIVGVYPSARTYGVGVKILSGGGTLEIVKCPAAFSGSSAIGWGTGYPIGSNESVTAQGPVTFYLAATGATMTAAVIYGQTSGTTLI